MSTKIAVHLVAMVVLGALAFAAFGFLVEWRQDQPVEVPASFPRDAASQGPPSAVLAEGVGASAATSRQELDGGHRGKAMHALDAAVRGAVVGRAATAAPVQWAFDHAWRMLEEARTDVEIGQPGAARTHLAEVSDTMRRAVELARSSAEPATRPADLDAYGGADVLNALGARIGEIDHADVDASTVTIRLGGSPDVFGVLDLGGSSVTVDAAGLLFGEPGAVGVLHVVVPTFGDDLSDAPAMAGVG